MDDFKKGDLVYISPKQTFSFFQSSYGIIVECNFPSMYDGRYWTYRVETCDGHTRFIVENDPFWDVILISQ